MRRSGASSRTRGATGLTLGLLVAFIAVTVGFFVLSQQGDGTKRVDSGSPGDNTATSVTASTTTTTTRPPIEYTVQAGDTLTSVAKQYGVSKTAILDANQIPDPDRLVPGQTFQIPSPTPVALVIRPAKARTGGSVEIRLKGAQPDELVTFLIVSPVGQFSGPAHSPDAHGTVTTSYRLGIADPPGTYTVLARGDQVTQADATFRVVAATP
jgi:LysM repeat protein